MLQRPGRFPPSLTGPTTGARQRVGRSGVQLARPQGTGQQQGWRRPRALPRGLEWVGDRGASERGLRPGLWNPSYRWRQAVCPGKGSRKQSRTPVSHMENKGSRMFTSHIHNGPSRKPSPQHSRHMSCGARPRRDAGERGRGESPGRVQGLMPHVGTEYLPG